MKSSTWLRINNRVSREGTEAAEVEEAIVVTGLVAVVAEVVEVEGGVEGHDRAGNLPGMDTTDIGEHLQCIIPIDEGRKSLTSGRW
jgi:hypothetical protein